VGALEQAVERLDHAVGDGLEHLARNHHRRRLAGLGWADSLAPADDSTLWAEGDPPPRPGNALEVLIDGERALPAIAAALEGARSHVHIAGWHLTPDFALVRGDRESPLRDLLAELAERLDVRVLLWAGPPLPVFRPRRSDVRAVRDELTAGTKVRCELDARERTMHCHHEKLVIVDDEVAFVGGIDLTSLSGDRFDSRDHPAEGYLGWHDVATRIRGPAVADVAEHFRCRWAEIAGEQLHRPDSPRPAGEVELQVVRTLPEKTYRFLPEGDFRILECYVRALRSARSLIYIENQFLWSAEIAEILGEKLRDPPSDDFRIVLLLPASPNNGADTTRGQLGRLIEADGRRGRLLPVTIHCHSGTESHSLYVHAKVGIVDDRWLTIGSANLNEHSLFNDTEMNVVTTDPDLALRTRLELWSEHLERPQSEVEGDAATVVDEIWKPIADEQLERREAGQPMTHRLIRLPAVSRRSKRLIGPMRGLLVDA
jgi:phosphatidylserine/phosphatidylglycerophosphate/cardiolipin synthase-like enzyme